MNDYQKFIAISRYARWLPNENRRETWEETVNRYVDFMSLKVKGHLPVQQIKDVVKDLLYDMDDIEIKTIKVVKV